MKYKKTAVFSIILLAILGFSTINNNKKTTETKIIFKETYPQEITFITFFNNCGHIKTFSSRGEKYYKTKEEVQKDYKNYEIKEFTEKKITLKRSENSFCPSHYLAKLNGKNIVITNRNTDKSIYVFSFDKDKMTEEENKRLIEGIEFTSKEAMLSFMEDYTS